MKYATFFGLNVVDPQHWNGWGGWLTGCVPDARDLAIWATQIGCSSKAVFTGNFGRRPPYKLRMDATRDCFIRELQSMSEILQPNDTYIVGYSGHGTTYPSLNEADGTGESFCFCDGPVHDYIFYQLLSQFKAGTNLIFILDACHSGGLDRAKEVRRYRGAPESVAKEQTACKRSLNPSAIKASCLSLCACKENQTASDGDLNGAWTGSLLGVWEKNINDQHIDLTWEDWFSLAKNICIRNFPQTPVLKTLGPDTLRGQRIFST